MTNSTLNLVEFDFTFNSSNVFDIGAITTNYTFSGFSGLSLRGFARPSSDFTKNFTIDKVNATAKAICIKDADVSFESISSSCNGNNEFLINCNNVTSNGYTCFDTGTRYKITGLNHSAVKELCVDSDGDGYGTGCTLGSDCNDNAFSSTNSCSSGDSGNSGGGSSGGGGGGGGGGAFFTCNMDWKCDEWPDCIKNVQIRNCNFVKVPQHTQSTPCPEQSKAPETRKSCEIPKVTASAIEPINQTKTEEKNQTKNIKQEKTIKKEGGLSAITGAVTRIFANPDAVQELKITGAVIVILLGIGVYYFKRKKRKT